MSYPGYGMPSFNGMMGNPYGQIGQMGMSRQMDMGQMPSNQLIRVTGIDGAKAYQMPPNSVSALFDSNEDVMYIKSTDGAGFPTIRQFTFTEVQNATVPGQTQAAEYVTREEFESLRRELEEYGKFIVSSKSKSAGKSASAE